MCDIDVYPRKKTVRIVTATSLFDGHDAAINIMRRVLQDSGAEVIHLGHNRSAHEVVTAAMQEDADAIAVSCYQGGHVEYFCYMVDLLRQHNASHIKIFGGGGGVIVPDEIKQIEAHGVSKIYSPEDGRRLGLQGIIDHLLQTVEQNRSERDLDELTLKDITANHINQLTQVISHIEYCHDQQQALPTALTTLLSQPVEQAPPVLGITGTGGAGKSSLVDELMLRFTHDFPDKKLAVISVDPSRRRTGGALLGDRIRMNALKNANIFMRSLATRQADGELSPALADSIALLKHSTFDLIIVETAGIGQGDAGIVPLVDLSLYVMTAEFGAASQLEKIDMLDFADFIAVNKFERKGAEDAWRDVCKQVQRNRKLFEQAPDTTPVFGTIAARFNDDGVTALYHALLQAINNTFNLNWQSQYPQVSKQFSSTKATVIPPARSRYLADIADSVRNYHVWLEQQVTYAEQQWQVDAAIKLLDLDVSKLTPTSWPLDPKAQQALAIYQQLAKDYQHEQFTYQVRDKQYAVKLYAESLSGTRLAKIALPKYTNPGDTLRYVLKENLPGYFPFTAGVFPFRRADEDPTRMFAGEGDAFCTNARFKYLSKNAKAKRLSTAFDSVTLYGENAAERPDIYGKVGTSGVSICSLADMKVLYDGFDLCDPATSVSMTINGPAPTILAFYLNTAIDQQYDKFVAKHQREPNTQERSELEAYALQSVRGTVQADILKEDQGQNTCIFAIDFALKMMADIQEYFIEQQIRNFYSVSISGYHIAEAGANPISQVAFTLANGFTFVEYYLARGMDVNDFAPNLSFFFSLAMDPEYAVINRVARRIWAVAMRERYGANERSQKLKTHIQTSGRSLHAQEIQFNDIRTTLEALTALYDNCNSLHTNSYDEAITTPTEDSVRRALAIQLIINKEHGLYQCENVLQGSFIIEELTDLVEEAILQEFERLSDRGGVLGAMETGYQRAKIQEESLYYERKKMNGEQPIIGVNTFVNPEADHDAIASQVELRRGSEKEKQSQLQRVADFEQQHQASSEQALKQLQQVAINNGNIFAELMKTVRHCTLGQITHALYQVGGEYRRNM